MGKWIEQRPYRLYFSERGISFYNGNGLVSHKQVKKDETRVPNFENRSGEGVSKTYDELIKEIGL